MYDFIKKYYVDRKNTNSSKWDNLAKRFDGDSDLLPMWVADMEFSIPNKVKNELVNRIKHGVFGYSITQEDYYKYYFQWMLKHHNVRLKQEWIKFNYGVVNSIYNLINIYTKKKDKILIMSPVYYCFKNGIIDNDRIVIENKLLYDNKTGIFNIDYQSLENDIVKNDVKVVIFCSPHNPVGRIWEEFEIQKCFEIFAKYNILIISDEIHQDFYYEKKFISALKFEKFYNNLIVLNSASKTFNLACLLHSHIIIPNKKLAKKYDNYAKRNLHIESNIIGELATKLSYQHGEKWLKQLKEVINHNYNLIKNEFYNNEATKNIIISPLEGTYLLFLNFNNVINKDDIKQFMQKECKIAIDYGDWFGKDYKGFIRVNLATHPDFVKDFINRVIENINKKSNL